MELYLYKMNWMLFFWQAVALLGICSGHNTNFKGYDLSLSGYHLCPVNETTVVSNIVSIVSPYKVRRTCGLWLPWKTCEVTLYKQTYQAMYQNVTKEIIRCCKGYEQVGSYCALPLNRSSEFVAKPGDCPNTQVLPHSSTVCEWDTDCPGWQKCCPTHGISHCTDPQPRGNSGFCFNVTVTVKTDYQLLVSINQGLLNHTRLLHSVITGAVDSPHISVNHVSSCPVDPFKTASSLLISSPDTLSLSNTTSKLQLLLKTIEEISSVTMEDVDECAYAVLRGCSAQANCTNTVGSYQCTCLPGYTYRSPNNTGTYCQASPGESNVTGNLTHNLMPTPMQVTKMPLHNASDPSWIAKQTWPSTNPCDSHSKNHTGWAWNVTSSASWPVSPGPGNSTNHQISVVPHTSMWPTVAGTTCLHAQLTPLQLSNVTGTSFCVSWTSQSQGKVVFLVVVMQGSMIMTHWKTNQTKMEVIELQAGVLYYVNVTSMGCGNSGDSQEVHVKTAAQTLGATAHLTNINFTNDLRNHTSQAYLNLTLSIEEEIKQSLSPAILEMVKSGEVRIQITNLAPGSVVVNFIIVFSPDFVQDVLNVSSALMASLQNSSMYTVDSNYTRISDVNECATAEHDCSLWAECRNTWGSYNCVCLTGYTDTNPNLPGRACEAAPVTVTKNAVAHATQTTGPTTHFTEANTSTVGTTANMPFSRVVAPTGINTSDITSPSLTRSAAFTAPIPINTTSTANTSTAPKTLTNSTTPVVTKVTTTIPPPQTAPATHAASTPATTTTAQATALATSATTAGPAASTLATLPPLRASSSTATSTAPATTHHLTTRLPLCLAPVVSVMDSISVECRPNVITVTVARWLLAACHIPDTDLYLGQPECGINGGNSTHPKLIVAWNECGTELLHNSSHYTALVNLSNSVANDTVMGSKAHLLVPIVCSYENHILISTGYNPSGYDIIKDPVTGSGTFRVTVRLLNGTLPLPQNYSVSPDETVVVEVSLNSTGENINLVINRCWATPSSYSLDPVSYVFMENSCPVPGAYTTVLENGNSSKSRLSVRIFSLVDHNVIYLHCQIQICIQMGSDTCVPNCIGPTSKSLRSFGSAEASCGPFHRSFKDSIQEGADNFQLIGFCLLGVGMSLFFIGCFSCLFYYNRNRIGHYNFSFKPKQENFTYHVFNT